MNIINTTIFPITSCMGMAVFCAYIIKYLMNNHFKQIESLSKTMNDRTEDSRYAHKCVMDEHKDFKKTIENIESKIDSIYLLIKKGENLC